MIEALPPGATIGILGGGQLGRMLSVAAARLGFKCHIFEPNAEPPAAQVAHRLTTAPYGDTEALCAFAGAVDVITYEFENIPTSALDTLEAIRPVRPSREALRISQDRLTEKKFLQGLGLQTAPFAAVRNLDDLEKALTKIGTPSILKTRRLGYDGKGQVRLNSLTEAPAAIGALAGAPGIVEAFIDFAREVSVIGARSIDGQIACYDPGENVHRGGILHSTTLPAHLSRAHRTDAVLIAANILNALDYVGVLAVELFVTPGGLIVNEIAPRVHNSGHWTQNGCAIDQFEQHIRAIAGWPLGDGTRHSDVRMVNLIGDDIDDLASHAANPATAIHLYGKAKTRPGRKMGHINHILGPAT
jgi:5-(carboxyamino)imidazole ribonucleotide synthase